MNNNFKKYESLVKVGIVLIFIMSIFIGIAILNLEPNLENNSLEFEKIVLDKSIFIKAYITLGIVTLLFESILYKILKLIREINNNQIISENSNKILKSMARTIMFYTIVTIFTGQINKILYLDSSNLVYKNEILNKIINSWLFNKSFNGIIIGIMIILVIILLQVLIEGVKIKEENDLTV